MVGPAPKPLASLLAPYGFSPWGPGWQSAACKTCDVVATTDHDCGVAFFPSMDQMVRYMLPSDLQPAGVPHDYLPERLRWSVAIGCIETAGPWVPDTTQGAFRVPAARLTELWVAPGSGRTSTELSAEYGVPAHAGSGDPSSWLLSLVPWGASAVPRQAEPSPIPPIEDPNDLLSVLRTSRAMLKQSREVSAKAQAVLAEYKAARARAMAAEGE